MLRHISESLIAILVAVILTSCELITPEPERGTLHIIGVAVDGNPGSLKGYDNDIREVTSALQGVNHISLNPFTEISITLFTDVFKNDAEITEFREELEQPSINAAVSGTINTEVKIITDKEGVTGKIDALDRNALLDTVEHVNQNSSENDFMIFYYTGHGHSGSGDFAVRGRIDDPKSHVPPKDLLDQINGTTPGRHGFRGKTLMIIDSCHSGFHQTDMGPVEDKNQNDYLLKAVHSYFEENPNTRDSDITVITASLPAQQSYFENPDPYNRHPENDYHLHSYFTKALLRGLGWNCSAMEITEKTPPAVFRHALTSNSIYQYVFDNQEYSLGSITNTANTQRPTISGKARELVLWKFK